MESIERQDSTDSQPTRSERSYSNVSKTSTTPIIHNVSSRLLSGPLSPANQHAIDWSHNGLIAFANHNRVVIAQLKKTPNICQSKYY